MDSLRPQMAQIEMSVEDLDEPPMMRIKQSKSVVVSCEPTHPM